MQNKIYNNVNVSTRILVTLLLILSILVANSIYLIIFLSILCLVFIMLTEKSVKNYLDLLKKLKILLLFIFIAYIIVFRNIFEAILFIYKIVLIIFVNKQLSLTLNFESLNNGINTLISLVTKKESNKISYDVTMTIYLFKFYLNSSIKQARNKKVISLKTNIIPRMFMAMNELKKLEKTLALKCYKPKLEDKNMKSKLYQILFIILFIIVIIKEVIL